MVSEPHFTNSLACPGLIQEQLSYPVSPFPIISPLAGPWFNRRVERSSRFSLDYSMPVCLLVLLVLHVTVYTPTSKFWSLLSLVLVVDFSTHYLRGATEKPRVWFLTENWEVTVLCFPKGEYVRWEMTLVSLLNRDRMSVRNFLFTLCKEFNLPLCISGY